MGLWWLNQPVRLSDLWNEDRIEAFAHILRYNFSYRKITQDDHTLFFQLEANRILPSAASIPFSRFILNSPEAVFNSTINSSEQQPT